jgi:hypothetical protein
MTPSATGFGANEGDHAQPCPCRRDRELKVWRNPDYYLVRHCSLPRNTFSPPQHTPSPLYTHITMASRTATRALRSSLRQAAKAPAVQQRTFVSAINAASRPALAQAPKAANAFVQQRGVKTVDFAGHKEDVYGRH